MFNPQKLTFKAQQALQQAMAIASEKNQQQITLAHFLLALINQEEGLVSSILKKLEVNVSYLKKRLEIKISGLAEISGGGLMQQFFETLFPKKFFLKTKKKKK